MQTKYYPCNDKYENQGRLNKRVLEHNLWDPDMYQGYIPRLGEGLSTGISGGAPEVILGREKANFSVYLKEWNSKQAII